MIDLDIMTWKWFLHYWTFLKGIHLSLVVSTHKEPVMQNFDVFFVIGLNIMLNNQHDKYAK